MDVTLTVKLIIGDVTRAPNLPPKHRWRRQVVPTIQPWRAEPIDAFEPGVGWQYKGALVEGDEFECRLGGRLHRLTVRADDTIKPA